jgi:hypothetical protein
MCRTFVNVGQGDHLILIQHERAEMIERKGERNVILQKAVG